MTVKVSELFAQVQSLYEELEDLLVYNEVSLLQITAIYCRNNRLALDGLKTPTRKRRRSLSPTGTRPRITRVRLFNES